MKVLPVSYKAQRCVQGCYRFVLLSIIDSDNVCVYSFLGTSIVAYYDHRFSTIRHVNCLFQLTAPSNSRCSACKTYQDNVLCTSLNRLLKQSDNEKSVTEYNSHANFHYLNTPEKMESLKNLSKMVRIKDKETQALRCRLGKIVTANGVIVNDGVHQDLLNIVNLHGNQQPTNSNTFASIFWNQQFKAATLKDRRQMKWHPAMIRWCLYLHTNQVELILLYVTLV